MSSLLRLVQQLKRFLKIHLQFAYFSFFLTHLLGHFSVFLPSQYWCARFGGLTAINNTGRTRWRARTEKKAFMVEVSQPFMSETVAFTIVVFEMICKEKDNYYCLLHKWTEFCHIVRRNNDRLCVPCCQNIVAVIIILWNQYWLELFCQNSFPLPIKDVTRENRQNWPSLLVSNE